MSYDNRCNADCAGVKVVCEGSCPCYGKSGNTICLLKPLCASTSPRNGIFIFTVPALAYLRLRYLPDPVSHPSGIVVLPSSIP